MCPTRQKFTQIAWRYLVCCAEVLAGHFSRIKLMSQERLKETRPRKAMHFLTIRHKKCLDIEVQDSTMFVR